MKVLTTFQEIVRCLRHVEWTWEEIVDGQSSFKSRTDRPTIMFLQGLAPKQSEADRLKIKKHLESGQIFSQVTDVRQRSRLFDNICSVRGVIPSLWLFFENLKYFAICQSIVKQICPIGGHRTLQGACEAAFGGTDGTVEVREGHYEVVTLQPQQRFSVAYLQLWLFAMRHWWEMTPLQPRKERKLKTSPVDLSHQLHLLPHFAKLALNIGFDSLHLRELQSCESAPLPSQPKTDQALVHISQSRCGTPLVGDQPVDQSCLFLGTLLAIETGTILSTLFFRQCFFLSYFEHPDIDVTALQGRPAASASQSVHLGSIHRHLLDSQSPAPEVAIQSVEDHVPYLGEDHIPHTAEEATNSAALDEAEWETAAPTDSSNSEFWEQLSTPSSHAHSLMRDFQRGGLHVVRFVCFTPQLKTEYAYFDEAIIFERARVLARQGLRIMNRELGCLNPEDAAAALQTDRSRTLFFCLGHETQKIVDFLHQERSSYLNSTLD